MAENSEVELAVLEANFNALYEQFERHRNESTNNLTELKNSLADTNAKLQNLLDLWNSSRILVKIVAGISVVATCFATLWAAWKAH